MDPHITNKVTNLAKFPELATYQCECDALKGYFHYKMKTSQNVSSEAQVKIFLFCIKVMFSPKIFKFFLFSPSHDLPNL